MQNPFEEITQRLSRIEHCLLDLKEQSKVEEPQKTSDELIPRKEAAHRLKCSLPTLDKWSRNGKIKAHRISAKIYYKESEINKALKEIHSINYARQ